MTHRIHTKSIASVLGAVLASLAVGCANGTPARAPQNADEQNCVETSLRRTAEPSSLPQAFSQFGAACAAGEASACSALGVMFELGRATPRDPMRAARLYQAACSARNVAGCVNLGLAHLHGTGVPADTARAQRLLGWGCERKHPMACRELGAMYLHGAGVAANVGVAASYYQAACRLGDGEGCVRLGVIAESAPSLGDDLQPTELFAQACLHGEAEGCDRLGHRGERRNYGFADPSGSAPRALASW